ncbi:hypothetical protein AVEN_247811-1 [Araneus ventricosus]|uniref:Mos1 transposase HTH domain-containing protein n=1 Tax=Araneus ventricosus TaxID=182803 RepID=A0A4Y2H8C7_ARAVE|nr:hypothetical protein AVEN_247811-1 [Araneus ventricosus]
MSQVYGENFTSDDVVHKWCRKFKDGRKNVHDEEGQGWKLRQDLVRRVPDSFWSFKWAMSDHLAYCLDLVTSYFQLILELKNF